MIFNRIQQTILLSVLTLALISPLQSCGPEAADRKGISEGATPEIVRVRIPADPTRLNPMLSRSGYASQIENNIFMYLLDHDPETLEFVPMLAKDHPEVGEGEVIDGHKTRAFTFEIRELAVWSDGRPVVADDYVFTLKAALNPQVPASSWRGFLQHLRKVETDPDNKRKFTVMVDADYMHGIEMAAGFPIYPEHIYDPRGLMRHLDLEQLFNYDEDSLDEREKNALASFAELFTSATYSSEMVKGAGPYELVNFESGQQITLERKEDWWGEEIFPPGPSRIHYLIIPDEAVTLSGLKDGSIDIASELPPRYFKELKTDESYADRFDFHTPPQFQLYYFALNNEDPILSERKVRRALAHMTDLDFVIDEIMGGFAVPAPAVVHPDKEEFNSSLQPIEYSIAKADSLLTLAGWTDTDGDGIRDKETDSGPRDLQLTIDVSSGEIGQNLALLMKETGERVGVDFNIRTREFRLIREDMMNRDYQMTPLVLRQSLLLPDLKQNWHTDSRAPDGNNLSLYSNPVADSLMSQIRMEDNPETLKTLYREVQELIYKDQAVIMLVAPTERVVVNSRLQLITSAKRPGYFEGMAQLKEVEF